MQFGLWLQLEFFTVDEAISLTRFAEDLGFHAVLVNDHFMKKSPRFEASDEIPEAYVTLAALASYTKRLQIGTAVTPLPLRPAAQLAKTVATLDILSEGRFVFGVGAGWYRMEFEGYGARFPPPGQRVSKMVEGLKLMKRLWTEDEVTFQGFYYNVTKAVLLPKPVQKPHPPILIGSRSPRMRTIVAKLADGWIPSHLSPREYETQMKEILLNAEKKGRMRNDFLFTLALRILLGKNKATALKSIPKHQRASYQDVIIGSPEECAERLQQYMGLEIDLILLRLQNVAQAHDQLSIIRDEIIPKIT